MSDRAAIRRRIFASIIAVILIALAVWMLLPPRNQKSVSSQISLNSPVDDTLAGGRTPASIRSAVLYDSYEHARENVPPRNDTSARANNWQPPPMPSDLIRTAAEKSSASDAQLIEFLKNWDTQYRSGKPLDGVQFAQLTAALEQTKLPFESLFKLGAAVGFLENASMAAVFHRAALRRANEEYKNLSPLHPAAPMLRAALPQMGMYWNNGDYPLLEQRFKLEMQLYPPLSQEARKCMHSCAEAMFYQGHSREAADLMVTKVKYDEQAGDLSASDKQEMGWIVGIFYGPDRNKEAIAALAVAAQSGGSRAFSALQVMASKIAQLPADEIEPQLAALEKQRMPPEQIQLVRMRVNEEVAARRPRTPEEQRRMEQAWEERQAFERAQSQSATRPTTRPVLTTQQVALLQARRAAPMPRPATRGTSLTSAQIDAARQEQIGQYQLRMEQQRVAAAKQAEDLVPELRALLQSNPRQAVDRLLNQGALAILMQARRFDDVEQLAVPAIIAASRDTWQVEQLQRFRVAAFNTGGKAKQALSAARAQFNVAGMGSVPNDLKTIATALRFASPTDLTIVNRFRLQQLAGAQSDPAMRKINLADLGENVMTSIEVDGAPFKDAIAARHSAADYDALYSLGNLLLISGRIPEARDVFEKVYKIAPPGELNYASEAIAKMIKAEDGCIGRANAFAAAIRPRE